MTPRITQLEMEQRLVRYDDLRPCTTAFLDTRTPGSQGKENFTIIGPGVAENPDQYVHINIPHGFNIGGARQTPGCVNSQHSHETAEVFIIHSGEWRFLTGPKCEGPFVDLGPGDTISIPVGVFRGFENVGTQIGFMFSVLGGDNPGRVTWAPAVFAAAAEHGLVLLEGGRLIDTASEEIPAGAVPIAPTTEEAAASMKILDAASLESCVARAADLISGGGLSEVHGFAEYPVIGLGNTAEHMSAGPIAWPHGFQVRALRIDAGAGSPAFRREEAEVVFVHLGRTRVNWSGGSLSLSVGDTLTIPPGVDRSFVNDAAQAAVLYIVRGGDHPHAAQPVDSRSLMS